MVFFDYGDMAYTFIKTASGKDIVSKKSRRMEAHAPARYAVLRPQTASQAVAQGAVNLMVLPL